MNLQGKKVAFLGDSITQGALASSEEKNFVTLFGKNEGATALNYGLGGTRIARQTKPSDPPHHDRDFVMRSDGIEKDADAVVVFGGTNDYGHGDAPFGKEGDNTVYTFCGACEVLFGKLDKEFPRAVKVAITPLGREGEENPPAGKRPLADYAAEVKAAALRHGWHVLDFYAMCKSDPEMVEVRKKLADGLHPDDFGHAMIAKKIAEFLKTL